MPSTPPAQNEENIKGKGSTGAKRVLEEVDTNVDIKKRSLLRTLNSKRMTTLSNSTLEVSVT